ncbi:MAG: hypothetical protein IPM50_08915 [Acidobacteriota bacterium]|nr:MAG: hypothetical protein IPM50_08915 [Acidobacteriota bacterium]
MSFTLIDSGSEGYEFSTSVWHWKAAVEIIKSLDALSEGTVRQMGYNAMGIKIDQEEAKKIADGIRSEILPKLKPNKRMFADLSITDEPDDGTIYRDEDEQWKNYSVTHDWLAELADFCERSKGFQIF